MQLPKLNHKDFTTTELSHPVAHLVLVGGRHTSSYLSYLPSAGCTELSLETGDVALAGSYLAMEGGQAGEGTLVCIHKRLQHQLGKEKYGITFRKNGQG